MNWAKCPVCAHWLDAYGREAAAVKLWTHLVTVHPEWPERGKIHPLTECRKLVTDKPLLETRDDGHEEDGAEHAVQA